MQKISIEEQTLQLLPEKAVFWEEKRILLIADAHFGKISHFRKAGIPLPAAVIEKDFAVLNTLIQKMQPDKLIFLGDLFHSTYNNEWDLFTNWRLQFSSMEVALVRGNHDIIPVQKYAEADMELHLHSLVIEPFLFRHEPTEHDTDTEYYAIAGHLHPGIRLSGAARLTEVLPCFWFGKREAVLPAFGRFTGLHIITPKKGNRIFVIAGEEVFGFNT